MNIGNVKIERHSALAPMAGIADRAFREIAIQQGASLVVGEMCSAKGVTYGSHKSIELLETFPAEQPVAVQLFGEEPNTMAKAVKFAQRFSPLIIDINMGCPAPKITRGGSGSSLMRNPQLAEDIIKAAVDATSIPVTVKFRTGWDSQSINAVDFAIRAQRAGAKAVTVHGRTKAQMYRMPVDLDTIRLVKKAVSIPVIGNGGITTPEEAKAMYDTTGCNLVMVGQGALGRPWLFGQIKEYLETGSYSSDPSLEDKMSILRSQVEKAVEYKGEMIALREARTHVAWYMKGLHGAASLRRKSSYISTLDDLDKFIKLVIETVEEE